MPALRRPEQLRQALAAVATRPEWNDYKEDSDEGERWRTDTDSWVASWALFATRVLSCWAADARHRWLPTRNNVNEAVACRPLPRQASAPVLMAQSARLWSLSSKLLGSASGSKMYAR